MARHMKVWYTEVSLKSLCDDASTMLRTWKRLIALSWPRLEPETKKKKGSKSGETKPKASQRQAKTYKNLATEALGTQRQQLEQRTMAVCPRPCLERPLLRRLEGMARNRAKRL